MLILSDSNRLAEAAYDLSQILYSQKNYAEITELLSGFPDLEKPDSYEIRSLEILGDAFYSLGRSERSDYMDAEAADYFIRAAEVYEILLDFQEDEADISDTYYSLGKAYRRLATLDLSREYFNKYYEMAVAALKQSDKSRAQDLLEDLENSRKSNFELNLGTMGGVDNITVSPGMDLTADAGFRIPLGYKKEINGWFRYSHDDFSFKTFNFDSNKTGDLRLIQSKDKISTDISLETGSKRNFQNTFRLDADYTVAEDFGDDNYEVKISEDGLLRINREWKTGWDSEFGWKVFPDYLVGGHKIDSLQGEFRPFVQWYFADKADLTLAYGLNIKQYLEAKYDTAVMGVDSTKDRQYITNSVEFELDTKINSIIDTSLSYEFSILESNNYDVWITDSSATDKYMEDYNDYLLHKVKGSVDFQWSDKFRTDFNGSFEIRNFTNYIAQDAAGVFVAGDEKRKDLTFSFDAELGFVIWENPAGAEAELIGQLWWDKSISNMEDEGSFDTNSDFFGGLLGLELRLP